MRINNIKRPWNKTSGNRPNTDPYYQTPQWKRTRKEHKASYTTLPDGRVLSNKYCIECFLTKGKLNSTRIVVDHKRRIKDGGSITDKDNLQSLCESCHASKSAREGNAQYGHA